MRVLYWMIDVKSDPLQNLLDFAVLLLNFYIVCEVPIYCFHMLQQLNLRHHFRNHVVYFLNQLQEYLKNLT